MFQYAYRLADMDLPFAHRDQLETRDRDLEQYLYGPPQTYTPTAILNSGAAAGFVQNLVGRWERQRGEFCTLELAADIVGAPGAGVEFVCFSLPFVPATVTYPSAGAWVFPPSGTIFVKRAGVLQARYGLAITSTTIGGVYYLRGDSLGPQPVDLANLDRLCLVATIREQT